MSKAALIVGAGDATGGAIAKAFAREGYVACINRRARNVDQLEALAQSIREEGYEARAYPADARIEEEVVAMVDAIERDVGPLEVAVFNIGANVNFSVLDMTAQVYRKVWEMAAFAGFLMGREAARRMVERQSGTSILHRSTISGSRAALCKTHVPFARLAAIKAFSVAPTETTGNV